MTMEGGGGCVVCGSCCLFISPDYQALIDRGQIEISVNTSTDKQTDRQTDRHIDSQTGR